ncbi:MAG: hypothetical protein NT061_07335 [Spirochaetes bacterium]|nr:hypothetical protein [Spirochaetota bacterium]
MKKPIIALVLFSWVAAGLFGLDISVPNEILSYKDLDLSLTIEEGVSIAQARFYFLQEGGEQPLYALFAEKEGAWSVHIPFTYLRKGKELSYYVLAQTTKGVFLRVPETGYFKSRLVSDVVSPSLKLLSPENKHLQKRKEQLVVFEVTDDSAIDDFEILYDGKFITKAAMIQNKLAFLITPVDDRRTEAVVTVSVVDMFNNKRKEDVSFSLAKETGPFFSAKATYKIDFTLENTLDIGKSANTTNLGTFFSDLADDLNLKYDVGGETSLKAGPLALDLGLGLGDDISVFDIPAAYPNSLIADYQNIMNLWNPWDFANEFNYSGEIARKFYNSNQIYARLSIFDPFLRYTFGDQKTTFQDETIKDFTFRGSSLSFDTPFLKVAVGKGLSDLGQYQTAWPQNFFGLKASIGFFDYWWLQTNVSFISSLQGRYDDIRSSGISPIGTLYDLALIKPNENLVVGLGTGTINKFFNLNAGLGLSLYTDSAGTILDTTRLAHDINEGFDLDIAPYLGYVDTVTAIFPVFDYFPLSDGLVVNALNRNLWGLTYGADLNSDPIGLKGWFHKTDASYKSLGASVDSDVMDWGGSWERPIGDFDLSLSFDRAKDNIPDILFNDILPLISPSMTSTATPTEDDISNIINTVDVAFATPPSGIFANASFTYQFEWATTDTDILAESISDAAAKALIKASAKNDTTLTHTGGIQMKSGRLKLGDFIITLGGKTKDSYITYTLVDGATNGSSIWDLMYGIDTGLQYKQYKLNLAFEHEWTTAAASDILFSYDAKFAVSKGFFDKMTFDATFDQLFKTSSLQKYGIGGGFTLEKKFGILETSATLKVGYVDSLVRNSDDALTSTFTVSGNLSL